jgi:hypothetical protein
MSEALLEPGDSLFVTWTIAWDIKAFLTDPCNIFNANIYYPYANTLAYSEHMIGVAICALPIYFFTKNPLLIYNLMLFCSFVLSGWGMYLLVFHLFKNRLAGVVSGIIFAFCPFRYDQLGHLHVLTCQWIPFALIILHKIIDGNSKKLLLNICFWFFCYLQFLSSGHNGLYLVLIVLLFLIYFHKEAGIGPWITLIIVAICLIPFYLPYIDLSKELGFSRSLDEFKLYSPQLISYIGVPEKNLIYGHFLSKFGKPEAVMFPGLIAILLVFYPILKRLKINKLNISFRGLNGMLNISIFLCVCVIFFVGVTGGVDFKKTVFGIKLKISDFTRPVYVILFLLGIKELLNWSGFKKKAERFYNQIVLNKSVARFYCFLAIAGFVLSFGPAVRSMDKDIMWGPYSLLYKYFPGFSGLRVSGRIYNVFILAFAILAGFGLNQMMKSFKIKQFFYGFIPVLVLIEYINIPLSMECRIGTSPSSSYRWLAEQKGNFAVIELPMPQYYDKLPQEIQYMYWSIFHWKKMVNGYSGYSPPAYWPIAEKMKDFPDEDTVEILKYLKTKYVVVHEEDIANWKYPSVVNKMGKYQDVFKLVFHDGTDYIYELLDTSIKSCKKVKYECIPKNKWSIVSNCGVDETNSLIDNNYETRWQSGASQRCGMQIQLDLGKIEKVAGVSMYLGKASNDYPRGIDIEISNDTKQWKKIPLKSIYVNYIKNLIEYPKNKCMFIDFMPEESRYIRITETRNNDVFFWSIYELDVYREVD